MSLLPDLQKNFTDLIDAKRFAIESRLSELKAEEDSTDKMEALQGELDELQLAVSEMHAGSESATERVNQILGLHEPKRAADVPTHRAATVDDDTNEHADESKAPGYDLDDTEWFA
jgi:hypothetical protein